MIVTSARRQKLVLTHFKLPCAVKLLRRLARNTHRAAIFDPGCNVKMRELADCYKTLPRQKVVPYQLRIWCLVCITSTELSLFPIEKMIMHSKLLNWASINVANQKKNSRPNHLVLQLWNDLPHLGFADELISMIRMFISLNWRSFSSTQCNSPSDILIKKIFIERIYLRRWDMHIFCLRPNFLVGKMECQLGRHFGLCQTWNRICQCRWWFCCWKWVMHRHLTWICVE